LPSRPSDGRVGTHEQSTREASVTAVATALRELWGLFVEDASLTLGILVCVVIAAWALPALGLREAWRGPVLFVLLAIVLSENVRRSARR